MPPPSVNTIFDHLDIMTFSSTYGSVSSALKSTLAASSLWSTPFPAKTSLAESLSALSSIHSDHDYYIKQRTNDCGMVTESDDHFCATLDYHNNGDAMLSSCTLDSEKMAGESADTDFLKDLDDLNFSFDDPCCEVAMEDSFQEFIDSALEQSYPPFFSDISEDKPAPGHDAVILNKEQFLAMLNLRTSQERQDDLSTPSTTLLPRKSSFSSIISTDKTSQDVNCNQSSKPNAKNACSSDVIPTRQCSCVESVFKAVYSTAHSTQQDCVRTCPSTLVTTRNCDNTDYTELPQGRTQETLISPIFVDTSSGGLSKSVQPSQEDCLDIMIDDDTPWRIDNDTVDIRKWLSDSQQEHPQHNSESHQEHPQHNSDSNNNIIHRVCVKKSSLFAETSSEDSFVAPSLDLESFVDLCDLDTEITDRNEKFPLGYTCERTSDPSKINGSVPCISQLKCSLLTEHLRGSSKYRHGSFSDVYSVSSHTDKLSPKSTDLSYCDFSPAWSRTDSTQSAVSPLPMTHTDISWSSNFDDAIDDSSVKSPFALLNLFSDENATSLLHTDSTVPNIRFM